jgi:hypothetical protein
MSKLQVVKDWALKWFNAAVETVSPSVARSLNLQRAPEEIELDVFEEKERGEVEGPPLADGKERDEVGRVHDHKHDHAHDERPAARGASPAKARQEKLLAAPKDVRSALQNGYGESHKFDEQDNLVLGALDKYAQLDKADRAESLKALEELESACTRWFKEKTEDELGRFSPANVNAPVVEEMRKVAVAAKDRLLQTKIERRKETQETLSGAAEGLGKKFPAEGRTAEADDLIKSLGAYKGQPHKNGKDALAALKDVEAKCKAWAVKNGADPEIEKLLKSTVEEREKVEKVQGAVAKLAPASASKVQQTLDGVEKNLAKKFPAEGRTPEAADLVQALEAYKRDSKVLASVDGLQAKCKAWLDKNGPDAEVEQLRAAAAEEAAWREKWERTGEWNAEGGLRIKDAKACKNGAAGKRGSAEAQVRTFLELVDKEAADSNIFAEVISTFADGKAEVPFYFGKNSCTFGDSFENLTVDQDDFNVLPDAMFTGETASQEVKGLVDKKKKLGCCKGEMVMHVIEERLYEHLWQEGEVHGKPVYNRGHYKCLCPDSYQNQYRKEKGADSHTVEYSCCEHGGEHQLDVYADDGVVATAHKLDVKKATDVSSAYAPRGDQTTYEQRDPTAVAEDRYRHYLAECKKAVEANPAALLTFESPNNNIGGLLHWIELLSGGDPVRVEEMTNEAQRILDDHRALALKYTEEIDRKRKDAKTVLDAAPNEQSKGLKALRGVRPPKGLNDADQGPYGPQYKHVNCALTTLAAITGQPASGAVAEYLEQVVGLTDVEKLGKYKYVQDQTVFWRAENGCLDPEANKFNETPGLPEDEKSAEVGDAQLRGLRAMLRHVAGERNKGKTDAKDRVKVVQDGVPEHKGMFDMAELLGRMKRYPDGAQFEVFVRGQMQHWLYAEKYNGEVVLEDYQKAVAEEAAAAYAHGSGPHNPLTNADNAFTEGMFLALTPEADDRPVEQRPKDPKLTEDWPQVGDDNALNALIAELNQARTLEAQAEFCKTRGTALGLDGSWAKEVENGIKAARDALAAGRLELFWQKNVELKQAAARVKNKQLAHILEGKFTRGLKVELDQAADRIAKEMKERYLESELKRIAALPAHAAQLFAVLEQDKDKYASEYNLNVTELKGVYEKLDLDLQNQEWAKEQYSDTVTNKLTALIGKVKTEPVKMGQALYLKLRESVSAPLSRRVAELVKQNRERRDQEELLKAQAEQKKEKEPKAKPMIDFVALEKIRNIKPVLDAIKLPLEEALKKWDSDPEAVVKALEDIERKVAGGEIAMGAFLKGNFTKWLGDAKMAATA